MRPLRESDRPDAAVLEQLRAFERKKPGTRWAAYQNVAMNDPALGHLQFQAIGPAVRFHVAPLRLPDTPHAVNCNYQFCGWVDLTTGRIEEGTPTEVEVNPFAQEPLRPLSELYPPGGNRAVLFSIPPRRRSSPTPTPPEPTQPSPASKPDDTGRSG